MDTFLLATSNAIINFFNMVYSSMAIKAQNSPGINPVNICLWGVPKKFEKVRFKICGVEVVVWSQRPKSLCRKGHVFP